MDYSRRDFLKIAAAGLAVPAISLSFSNVAHAREQIRGGYSQVQADRIHDRSTEEAIRQAGANPKQIKIQVDHRLHELRQRVDHLPRR